ncbi:MAG: hypothetical protein HQM04_15625 [Magnetococcales bacterium]|nr:hypothetical protein [Magnetococcales bacterium]
MTKTTLTEKIEILARFARKPRDIGEMLAWIAPDGDGNQDPPEKTLVHESIQMTNAEYDDFADNMLEPRAWIEGGGFFGKFRIAIAIESEGRQTLYLDPSGHNYGRYVGIAA